MSVLLEDGGGGDNNTSAAAAADNNAGGGGSSTVSRSGSKGSANGGGGGSTSGDAGHGQNAFLKRLFYVFEKDPKGAVHRAWGITLLFIVAFFVISVIEMVNIKSSGRSQALTLTAVLTGFMHLLVAILGTFVLRRFPTSFSVGFLLGLLVVLANQNLLLEGIYRKHGWQANAKSNLFANMGTCLFLVLAFFSVLLYHFKNDIVVAPLNTSSGGGGGGATTSADNNNAKLNTAATAASATATASSSSRGGRSNKAPSLASLSPATSPSSSVDYQTTSSRKKHHHRRGGDADDDDDYNYHRHGDEEAT